MCAQARPRDLDAPAVQCRGTATADTYDWAWPLQPRFVRQFLTHELHLEALASTRSGESVGHRPRRRPGATAGLGDTSRLRQGRPQTVRGAGRRAVLSTAND